MQSVAAPRRLTRSHVLRAGAGAGAAASLAACGAPAAGTSQASQSKRSATIIVDNDWSKGDRHKVVQAWLDRAGKVYPHLKTQLNDNAESQDKTIAVFAADQQGDLFQMDQHMIPVFGPKGVLQEITSTLASLKFDTGKLFDVENITHWNGKRHGLLIQLNTHTGVYNKNAFQEAGLKEPTIDWTWNGKSTGGGRGVAEIGVARYVQHGGATRSRRAAAGARSGVGDVAVGGAGADQRVGAAGWGGGNPA